MEEFLTQNGIIFTTSIIVSTSNSAFPWCLPMFSPSFWPLLPLPLLWNPSWPSNLILHWLSPIENGRGSSSMLRVGLDPIPSGMIPILTTGSKLSTGFMLPESNCRKIENILAGFGWRMEKEKNWGLQWFSLLRIGGWKLRELYTHMEKNFKINFTKKMDARANPNWSFGRSDQPGSKGWLRQPGRPNTKQLQPNNWNKLIKFPVIFYLIWEMPGSGLAELIQQISDNHQKFSLTNLINNLRKTHQAEGIVVEE